MNYIRYTIIVIIISSMKGGIMNIFKFAIEFERENRAYYLERSRNTNNVHLSSLFKKLAEEEKKHEMIVNELMAEKLVADIESDINVRAKDFFRKIADNLPETFSPTEEIHVYKEALELERKSKDFYLEQAEKTDLIQVEKVFRQLSREEAKHEEIMENIVEMVDRPNTWLEDAEWYHMEDY